MYYLQIHLFVFWQLVYLELIKDYLASLALILIGLLIDKFIDGFNTCKQVFIITQERANS